MKDYGLFSDKYEDRLRNMLTYLIIDQAAKQNLENDYEVRFISLANTGIGGRRDSCWR